MLSLVMMQLLSILHVCGGDPSLLLTVVRANEYSPRMWR